jgi:hypothetical protein
MAMFVAKMPAITASVNKLQLTRQNLSQVINFRNGCLPAVHFLCYGLKLTNFKLKTHPQTTFRFQHFRYRAPLTLAGERDN